MSSPTRIAVFGTYKTGTTGLWTKIREALPYSPRTLFEPAGYDPQPGDAERGVLAKVMIPDPRWLATVDHEPFRAFERLVMIRRDPRDWLVSALLFVPQQLPRFYEDQAALDRVLEALRRKQADPWAVPFCDLCRDVIGVGHDLPGDEVFATVAGQLDLLTDFERSLPDPCSVHYEDFVDGRLDALGAYLGVEFAPGVPLVDPEYRHVPRTCAYGNWRDWFTPEDVERLRPLMAPYMERSGYPDDWTLADDPHIPTHFGSGYVERVVTLRRRRASPSAQTAW